MQQSESNQTPPSNLRQKTGPELLMADTSDTSSRPGCGRQTLMKLPMKMSGIRTTQSKFPPKRLTCYPAVTDAYTDGSLMGGKSGAGAFILKKSEGKRRHFCSPRGNTEQATVFQSEVLAVKAAAKALISNNLSGNRIVFHVDNQATLKALDSTDITKKNM
jgi:hypothetical protein